MKAASWTVMVVGGSHEGVRRFSLKRKAAVAAAFVCAGGLLGASAVGTHYATLSASVFAANSADGEHAEVQERLEALEARLTRANEKVAALKDVDGELRSLTHFGSSEAVGSGGPSERAVAAGGSTYDLDPFAVALVDDPVSPTQGEVTDSRVEAIADDAERQVLSLKGLLAYFESRAAVLASTPSVWPAEGAITSEFGHRDDPFTGGRIMHAGVDVGAPEGRAVTAPADGKVVFAGNSGGYGQLITIEHGRGISTQYGHLSRILVKVGDEVKRGQHIGAVGNTGRSTGPHLHYEVRKDGMPVNPRKYVLEW